MPAATHTFPSGASLGLRGDVPAYTPPDRAAWAQTTRCQPYRLDPVHPKFITRAKGAIARDWNTLSFEQAIVAHEQLDAIGLRLAAELLLPESSTVFFDSADDSFWVYPQDIPA